MKVKDFKPEFLYVDKQAIEFKENNYKTNLSCLNKLIAESEIVLNRKLTTAEKNKMKNKGAEFVEVEVKKQFQFKNADENFNLEALGINIEPFRKASSFYLVEGYDADLVEGKFIPSEKQLNILTESSTIYTSNEKQKHALKIANTLIELIKDAEDLGLPINKHSVRTLFLKQNHNNEFVIDNGLIAGL